MSTEGFDIEYWLGAEVSGKVLPKRVQTALKKSYDEKTWDEMFLSEDGTLEGAELKEAVELFSSILDDSSGTTAARCTTRR